MLHNISILCRNTLTYQSLSCQFMSVKYTLWRFNVQSCLLGHYTMSSTTNWWCFQCRMSQPLCYETRLSSIQLHLMDRANLSLQALPIMEKINLNFQPENRDWVCQQNIELHTFFNSGCNILTYEFYSYNTERMYCSLTQKLHTKTGTKW
jgi:hypothetical protein